MRWPGSAAVLLLALLACGGEREPVTSPPAAPVPEDPRPPTGQAPDGPVGAGRAAAPMERLAGVRAVQVHSRVRFDSDPARPHDLRLTLAFPDRARWMLSVPDVGEDRRVLHYQHGTRAWTVDATAGESRTLLDAERARVLRRLALRRALLTGGDGPGWTRVGEVERRDLGQPGHLERTLDDRGRPVLLRSLDPAGDPDEELRVLEWSADAPGPWPRPRVLELWSAGVRVWSEELLEVRLDGSFLDDFFVPPDRRERRPTRTDGRTTRVRLGAGWTRPEPCPTNALPPALAAALAARDALAREHPERAVEALLHLDAEGNPSSLELWLGGPEPPGPGEEAWSPRPELAALALNLDPLPGGPPHRAPDGDERASLARDGTREGPGTLVLRPGGSGRPGQLLWLPR